MRVCLVSQEARETADSMDYLAAMAKTGFREPMEPRERPEYVLRKDAPIVRREREDLLEIQDPEDKMETSASTALREIPDLLAYLVWTLNPAALARKESEDFPVTRAEMDCRDQKETPEFQVEMDPKVTVDCREFRDSRAHQDCQAETDCQEMMGCRGRRDLMANREIRDRRDWMAPLDHLDQLDPKEMTDFRALPARMDCRDFREQKEMPALPDFRVKTGCRDKREREAWMEFLGLQDQKVLLDFLEERERREKPGKFNPVNSQSEEKRERLEDLEETASLASLAPPVPRARLDWPDLLDSLAKTDVPASPDPRDATDWMDRKARPDRRE